MSKTVASLEAERAKREALRAVEHQTLKSGGGDGTSGEMEIVDAKIAAAEARTDTKFAELRGDLKAISASTSGLKATVITTVVGTGIAVLAVTIAVIAYGGQMFGSGLDASTAAREAAAEVEQRYAAERQQQTEYLQQTNLALQETLRRLEASSTGDAAP